MAPPPCFAWFPSPPLRGREDRSAGPFPFVTISCNSVAMTSDASNNQNIADPAALVEGIIAELQTRFRTSVSNLKSAIAAYVHDGTLPPADAAATGIFDYPAIRLTTTGE
jgi:AMP nucleosidase